MTIKELINNIPQVGKVEFISIRPEKRADPVEVQSVVINKENGLEGDHYSKVGTRMVTLIQQEHLDAVASILKKPIDPLLTRRNIVVSGINLISLKDHQFQIGSAILETTGECVPCSRMEQNFGEGGYNAMRGHGGITCKVIGEGACSVGDDVKLVEKKA